MLLSRRAFVGSLAVAGVGALTGARAAARGRVIDFHNHYHPPEYLEALRASGSDRLSVDPDGTMRLLYPGESSVIVRGHRDLDFRERVLDEHEVDVQVLSFPNPGTHVEPPDRAAVLARLINDALASVVSRRPKRFAALATLPLNDPAASAVELERAITQLGLRGALILSNVNGVPLSDPRFWRLYEKANELGALFYVHPTSPAGAEHMAEFRLPSLVGFPFDLTLAAARLVLSGVVERFPRITWALAILGGAIPYLAERLDRGFQAFAETRAHISRPPSEYLKQLYYDTVNFDGQALQLAIAFAGASHLLAGSDYPQQIGSLRSMVDSIQALPIPDTDKANILGNNAARLLRLGA